jgi:Actinobacteria/chloroflexi VLRF1 release factor
MADCAPPEGAIALLNEALGTTRFVGRANVRKRFAPLDGTPGRTTYERGSVRIEAADTVAVVTPPFGMSHEGKYDTVQLTPLFDTLAEDHLVAVLLVRLGGYAAGVFEGERLVASKVGSRFVKNRHKKGGRSSNRFRRRREEQARALIDEAARVAADTLEPWRERVEFCALGGDRSAVAEVLATHPRLDWLAEKTIQRFFTVAEPRQNVLERLSYDLYSAEVTDVGKETRAPR